MSRDDAVSPSGQSHVRGDASAERFVPYLPRLAVDWLRLSPDTTAQHVKGSMVFIDVSGFTALSERLARRGKAGAEELTDVLDTVFTRLLTRAWDLGGGLVKFGGDALLMLFRGDEHPRRACAAAYDMRSELADLGRLETSSGPVTLQMSVGVHSGGFEFFLVGDSHRELVLAGPGATTTVEAEGAAAAGQILVSAAAAAELDAGVLGEVVGPGRLLVGRPDAPEFVVPSADLTGLQLDVCVPLALRRHLVAGAFEPEHRVVTVGFLHFQGVDRLLAEEGLPRAAEAIETVVRAVQHHLDEQELCFVGSDVYGDGGKLILTAGAPTTHGNDEERLLRALRGVFEERLPLPIRAGVNRGHVYAGEVGPEQRRTYTVMGDAVNLAARLMQAASPGQILATGPVVELADSVFDVAALPPFLVKGKRRAVQAYTVGPILRRRHDMLRAELPLVGREAELEQVLKAADDARSGNGRVVQIVGPAGIGKTRLVEEVRERALTGFRQYRVTCEQYELSTAYWPFMLLIRRLLGIPADSEPEEAGVTLERYVRDRDPHLLPWLPLLASVIDATVATTEDVEELDQEFRQAQVERVTVEFLDRLLGGAEAEEILTDTPAPPAAVVIEDVYWMDEASRRLLTRLGAEVAWRPWLFLLTSRDVDQSVVASGSEHVEIVRLTSLQLEDLESLATSATERSPRPVHELSAAVERAGGNPLFLLELVASGPGTQALPESIEAAIGARLDLLDAPDRLALRCAAVIGGPSFPVGLANDVLPLHAPAAQDSSLWERLDEFIVREAHDRMRFRHVLIRDVAYEGLSFRRRRALHAAVVDWIEKQAGDHVGQAELLALHCLRAERFEQAFRYARVAGDHARDKAANADAATFYRQGLDAARQTTVPPDDLADVAEALGDVSEYAGLYSEGALGYRWARSLIQEDRVRLAEVLRKEGLLRERLGRYRQARHLYVAGIKVAMKAGSTAAASRARANLETWIAGTLAWEGRYRACVWWARRAASRAAASGAKDVLAHAYYVLDWALTDLGEPDNTYRQLALPIYEELGDYTGQGNVLNNLGGNAYYAGQWEEALKFYERSRHARQKAGDVVQAATATSNIAEILCQQGHSERAEQQFRESLRTFRAARWGIGIAWVTGYIGLLAARLGRLDEGRRLLGEARESCREMGLGAYASEAGARLIEVCLLANDTHGARTMMQVCSEEAEARDSLPYLPAMLKRLEAQLQAQQGDLAAASRTVDVSLHVAEAADTPYEVALCLDLKARLATAIGRPEPSTAHRAHELFRNLGVVEPPRIPLPTVVESTDRQSAVVRMGEQ